MHANYCCCDLYLGSVVGSSDGGGANTLSDTTKEEWEAIFVPSSSSRQDFAYHSVRTGCLQVIAIIIA